MSASSVEWWWQRRPPFRDGRRRGFVLPIRGAAPTRRSRPPVVALRPGERRLDQDDGEHDDGDDERQQPLKRIQRERKARHELPPGGALPSRWRGDWTL